MVQSAVIDQAAARGDGDRLATMVRTHAGLVWRTVRRFGVAERDADDAAQQVFVIASQKIESIELGKEKAFLFAAAMRVAANTCRKVDRRAEDLDAELTELADQNPNPEALLDQRRARDLLDAVLARLSVDLRAVFVLYEIEEMTMAEVAEVLDVPSGTVASRLRRARSDFEAHVRRLQLRKGGQP